MLFFGGLALLLNVLLLGVLWPHKARHEFGAGLWGYMVKALFLSWFWFLLSFFTDVGSIAQILVGVLFVITAFKFVTGDGLGAPNFGPGADWRLAAFWGVAIIMSLPALSTLGTTFSGWDAIGSWNRWAIGFTQHSYRPIQAAYPVFWPAIWSLIYESQGTTLFWFVAKASLIAPAVLISIYASGKLWGGRFLSGAYLCASLYFLFLTAPALTTGYMDIPVALMGLAALLFTIDALDAPPDDSRRNDLLLFAVLSASLAIITKQAGAMFAVAVLIALIYLIVRRELSLRFGAVLIAVMAVPVATFLWLYLTRRSSVYGNLDHLVNLIDAARGKQSKVAHAFDILAASQPWIVFGLLGFGVFFNVVFARSRAGAFGLLCCVMAAIGFFVFADCCSYQVRNGLWIYSFILASGWVGVRKLETCGGLSRLGNFIPMPATQNINRFVSGGLIIGYVVGLLALGAEWPGQRLVLHQDKALRQSFWANEFLWQHRGLLKKYPVFVSNYPFAGYLSFARKKYIGCRHTTEACIANYSKAGYFEAGEPILIFSISFLEDADSRKFISSAIADGNALILAKQRSGTLLEFRSQGDATPQN